MYLVLLNKGFWVSLVKLRECSKSSLEQLGIMAKDVSSSESGFQQWPSGFFWETQSSGASVSFAAAVLCKWLFINMGPLPQEIFALQK